MHTAVVAMPAAVSPNGEEVASDVASDAAFLEDEVEERYTSINIQLAHQELGPWYYCRPPQRAAGIAHRTCRTQGRACQHLVG